MKKFKTLVLMVLFALVILPFSVSAAEYEAQILVKKSGSDDIVHKYATVEEAFADIPAKETEYTGQGNIYLVLQLLEDVDVSTTLTAQTTRMNFQIDMNGKDIVSSADPVIELKVAISGITNISEEPCSITQKNVTNVSATTPNTIVSLPQGAMSTMLNAPNVTFGDGTGTAVNSKVTMPLSVSAGIYLGKMELAKPMFLSAITGGYFDQDPTAHIDTLAYEAILNKDNLYEIKEYIVATVTTETGVIVKKYADIQKAFDDIKEGEEIQVLKQAYPFEQVLIDEGEKILLDFHGFQFLASGCPNSLSSIKNQVFIKNLGELTITSKTTQTSTNFVYDETPAEGFASTIQNKGTLSLEGINVNINYNQPNRKGAIYAITNDSTTTDAKLFIDEKTFVGGMLIEPEDPATGKYPALHMIGDKYKHANEVVVEYKGKDENTKNDNDLVIFKVENTVVEDIHDAEVFDANGNFVTKMYLTGDKELKKKNIKVEKAGVAVEFEYDETTDTLTIPAAAFTDGADEITISYVVEVTYVVDGNVLSKNEIQMGTSATNPTLPEKDGYTANWDHDGKNILEDTTINALYKANEEENPKTADKLTILTIIFFGSGVASVALLSYKVKQRA